MPFMFLPLPGMGKISIFAYQMVGIMEDSREYILKTAYTLFLQKSYKDVTFKELMEKTGFSKGAFYHYFKSKEHIFEAIIDNYFATFVSFDYRFSQTSFRNFLNDYFRVLKKTRENLPIIDPETGDMSNHYLLIFEALRIIPGFKNKVLQHEQQELAAWVNIIKNARDNKEIKSTLSDKQLARLFINSGDGAMLHLIMTARTGDIEKKTKEVWNNLYALIKV